jgi:ribonuclease HI
MEIKLFSDGGSRGNPGSGACGWLIYSATGELLDFGGKYLGICTNNFAEYHGLIYALTAAMKIAPGAKISCHLDSELIVKQISGEYKVKDANLKLLHTKVQKLLLECPEVSFKHVPRAENKFADKLVNLVLDTHEEN